MKNTYTLLLFALLLFGSIGSLQAEVSYNHEQSTRPATRRKKINPNNGLYQRQHPSVGRGVALSFDVLYYYGDVDMLDQAFVHGWQQQNLTLGGSLKFNYLHQIANTCNLRFSLSGGWLQGNDSARTELNTTTGLEEPIGKGYFKDIFGEFSVGVEWYPFHKADLYIYAGLGFSANVIDYNFARYGYEPDRKVTVVPMLPIEIGYNFNLTHGFFLTISASVHQALMDTPNVNLDAWPVKKSSRFQWGDGYFTLGLSFSYRWQRCEPCRLSNW